MTHINVSSFFLYVASYHRDLHSFPTRRSSDLPRVPAPTRSGNTHPPPARHERTSPGRSAESRPCGDRKSTRLNSSHTVISYAVFCWKKKKENAAIIYITITHKISRFNYST